MNDTYIYASKAYTKTPKTDMFKIHLHENYELFCFVKGNANYFVEGNIYSLNPYDILLMKKAESHTLLINIPEPYERIVVNFDENALFEELAEKIITHIDRRSLGQENRYSLKSNDVIITYLNKLCETNSPSEQKLYLNFILNEICNRSPNTTKTQHIDLIDHVVEYINSHLFDDFNLDILANHFKISKNQLSRKFKTQIGTTIWDYVLTKRLITAKELLSLGNKPTNVAMCCGFNDYCTFYRAYKSRYKTSPINDYIKPQ